MRRDKDVERVLLSERKIKKTILKLGKRISKDYNGKNPLVVCVLKGSVITVADLLRSISIPCEIDFISASSYGSGTVSSGTLKITKDLNVPITGRDVIIVEDIIDTGVTLSKLAEMLRQREPSSLKICTLLDKPDRRVISVTPDYIGCRIPDEFVVGYGLDYNEKYRNLPYIGILKKSVYTSDTKE